MSVAVNNKALQYNQRSVPFLSNELQSLIDQRVQVLNLLAINTGRPLDKQSGCIPTTTVAVLCPYT